MIIKNLFISPWNLEIYNNNIHERGVEMKKTIVAEPIQLTKGQRLRRDIWRSKELYMFLLPAVVLAFIFQYIPMYGIQIAWKQLRLGQGMFEGTWIGWKNFQRLFNSIQFTDILMNTLTLNIFVLIVTIPVPLFLAVLMHNSPSRKLKAFSQTTTYLPHMVSLVIIVQLLQLFTNYSSGLINIFLKNIGLERINFWAEEEYFIPLYTISAIWSSSGYNAIIYLSALTSIDQSVMEAARIDGASKVQRMWHIDLKLIIPTIATMLILNMGKVLTIASMEKVLLMQTPANLGASEIISTYVYTVGIVNNQYGFSTAVNVFNSLINILMLFAANWISKKVAKTSMF